VELVLELSLGRQQADAIGSLDATADSVHVGVEEVGKNFGDVDTVEW